MKGKKNHYLYRCQAIPGEDRGKRPQDAKGCGRRRVFSTNKDASTTRTVQGGPCPVCGRRTRLSYLNIEQYHLREDCERLADERNWNEYLIENPPSKEVKT